MIADTDIKHLLRRIAEALERLAPPPVEAAPVEAAPVEDPEAFRSAFDLLSDYGVREPALSRLAATADPATIQAWTAYIDHEAIDLEYRPGYLIRRLQAGDPPPPRDDHQRQLSSRRYHDTRRRYVRAGQEDSVSH